MASGASSNSHRRGKFRPPVWRTAEEFLHRGNSITALDHLLRSSSLSIGARLQLADDALSRGLITADALAQHKEPKPSDFGLHSKDAPVAKPFATVEESVGKRPGRYFLFLVAFASLYIFARIGSPSFGALIGAMFLGVFVAIFLAGVLTILFQIARDATPQMRQFKKYVIARDHYDAANHIKEFLTLAASAKLWLSADGPGFEYLVARHFRAIGWSVTPVGGSNDGGVDLRLARGSERAIVQCKAYAKVVSPSIVRELYGALLHEKCSHAYFATLHGVSSAAKDWSVGKPITILTLDDFLDT